MHTRRWFLVFSVVGGLLVSGCGGSDDANEVVTYEVAAYQSPCQGSTPQMCLNVRSPGQAAFTFFYSSISGFSPQWGRNYTIEVDITKVPNPPVNGSDRTYQLRRVISEAPVAQGTQFTVTALQAQQFVVINSADTGAIGGSTPFVCSAAQLCTDLQALLTSNAAIKLTFGYSASANALPLILTAAAPN
jgi:hypothetical protein